MTVLELPGEFSVDVQKSIIKQMRGREGAYIDDLHEAYATRDVAYAVDELTGLIINGDLEQQKTGKSAYYTGALLAIEAFILGDSPEELRNRTISEFVAEAVPLTVRHDTLREAASEIYLLGAGGYGSHVGEVNLAARKLTEFYSERGLCMEYGKIAYGGVGLVLGRLDTAYQSARNNLLVEQSAQLAVEVDDFLRDLE